MAERHEKAIMDRENILTEIAGMKQEMSSWKDLLFNLQESFNIICDEVMEQRKQVRAPQPAPDPAGYTATFSPYPNQAPQEVPQECKYEVPYKNGHDPSQAQVPVIEQTLEKRAESRPGSELKIVSSEYQLDGSMILHDSKAEVDLQGINDDKERSYMDQSQQPAKSSQFDSKVFSISPEMESCYSQKSHVDFKENVNNQANRPQHLRGSKSSGFIKRQKPKILQNAPQNIENSPQNQTELIKTGKISTSEDEEYKEKIMSMYSSNQVSKKDILDNILEVEKEDSGPDNLRIIAYKLKKKLEEKAEKLKSLRLSQQFGSNPDFKEEDYSREDYSKEEYSRQDYSRDNYIGESYSKQDYSKQDYSREDYTQDDRVYTGEYDSYEEEEEEVDSSIDRDLEEKYFNHSLSDIYTSQASYRR
ncbi:unnamed protein product [Moneuplotes crassus]|uniref:Uncharacterized protein n=1 Tax=Euplotes crassus TaxID=5936 RepID=A0AAD1UH51_EUPCR|nr:unnamed protein product [Moneuplotes crassus]